MPKEEDNYDDFEYVIKKNPPAKICFGSGHPRKLIITYDKPVSDIGPARYNIKTTWDKVRSKRGFASLASTTKRVTIDVSGSISPDPCKYSKLKSYVFKPNCAPFNSSVVRLKSTTNDNNPAPTTYQITSINKCKKTRFDYNFGKPCVVPAVEMVCINYPNKWCEKCGEAFEYGDFWHRNYQEYLCTLCMDEEHRLHELFKERELCTFKKIRTCTFMHRHEGTSAAIRLMPKNKITKKLRLENYLSLYIHCYCSGSRNEIT